MSSKGKPSAEMGGGATLVPKLRFPEFIGHPIQDLHLADATVESTERNGSGQAPSQIMGVSKVEGIVPMEERIVAADTARYKFVRKDWFAYNPMRLNIGSIARWQGNNDILVSPDYVVFKCKGAGHHRLDPAYLDHFRRSDAWEEFVSEKGDGSVRVRIYYKDLARLQLALPSLPEQQKIADCLDSVDALIAWQGRKVEALGAHKKGLMQQLFPQEGEGQPRLRFPEFEGAGEWEEKPFSAIVDLISGLHLSPDEYSESGEVPYFSGPSDFTDELSGASKWTASTTSAARSGDTLITVKGSGVGEVWFSNLPAIALGRQLMAVRPKEGQIRRFVFQFLLTKKRRFKVLGAGNLIPGLSRPDILELKAFFPRGPEQQRIADCLTSLDDLITTETRKLDTLKTHKKGLMQQLFPQVGEAGA
ncbi:restriction endonuclease subunit S [Sinorhizobium meliloti]|uniref:restriction endonuclease subunit S n=1 Tax=Rhizobium meliloti TaxID=382 RepID=UPI001294D65B|nr:restriction endonuclease subunit S [Sinorhizobium meliloti]MQX44874.1 restriction endonuclease subunit S [Sinorhizobium meliloti]